MGDPSEAPAQTHIGDQYDVPEFEAHSSVTTLKERIRHHYELASDYYYSLWSVDDNVVLFVDLLSPCRGCRDPSEEKLGSDQT